jgi:hypothetical protein
MMYVTRIRKPSPVLSGPVLRTSHLIYLDRGGGVLRGDLSKASHAHRLRCVSLPILLLHLILRIVTTD